HQPENAAAFGTTRYANADFSRAAFDQIRHYSVDTDGGKEQRKQRKIDGELRDVTNRRFLVVDARLKSLYAGDRLLLVHCPHGTLQSGGEGHGIRRGVQDQMQDRKSVV